MTVPIGEQATGEQATGEQATAEQVTAEQATVEQTTGKQATGEQATGEQATGELATGKRQAKQPLFGVHATPRNLSKRLYDSESLQIATSFSMVANNTYEPLL